MADNQLPAPGRSLAARRRRILASMLAAVVLLIVGGWMGSRFVKSPAQVAADAAPPPPSVLTAPIEMRVVSRDVITRGQVVATRSIEAVPRTTPADAARAVISELKVKAGQRIEPGDAIIEISGRPVIALPGDVPAYRDLAQGMQGKDVARLQQALRGAGRSVRPDKRGYFGPGTAKALAATFRAQGYSPMGGVARPRLPAWEVVFLGDFPGRVLSVSAVLGQDASSASIQLSSDELEILVPVSPPVRGLLRAGQRVAIDAEAIDGRATGTLTGQRGANAATANSLPPTSGDLSVSGDEATPAAPAEPAATAGGLGGEETFVIEPTKPLPADWLGQDVRVTITSASSKGKVLAVPVTAVSAGGDGQNSVIVVDRTHLTASGEPSQRRVPVRVGVSGGGYVEIAASSVLRAGDQVLVGRS